VRAIGLTVMSLVLFGIVSAGYLVGMAMLTDGFGQERINIALIDALFLTVFVFFSFMYFPFQLVVLTIDRLKRSLLFVFPILLISIAAAIFFYRSLFVIEDRGSLEEFFSFSPFMIPSLIFVLLNNLLIIRNR
jgi:hypothetical protein